jgi:hypothetical protein
VYIKTGKKKMDIGHGCIRKKGIGRVVQYVSSEENIKKGMSRRMCEYCRPSHR